MAYYNPFTSFMPTAPVLPMSQQGQVRPPVNPQQFKQFAITLNDNALNNFAQMARQHGISEQDIAAGIQFIKSL